MLSKTKRPASNPPPAGKCKKNFSALALCALVIFLVIKFRRFPCQEWRRQKLCCASGLKVANGGELTRNAREWAAETNGLMALDQQSIRSGTVALHKDFKNRLRDGNAKRLVLAQLPTQSVGRPHCVQTTIPCCTLRTFTSFCIYCANWELSRHESAPPYSEI